MKKSFRGFTLIELLVVIAIIGILSSVVLASLNTARQKGSDAAIKSDIDGIRNQAQLYQNDNAGLYNTTGVATTACGATGTVFADNTVKTQVAAADTANAGTSNSVVCNTTADGSAYAVSAQLVTKGANNVNRYYCVDSTGVGTTTTGALGTKTSC